MSAAVAWDVAPAPVRVPVRPARPQLIGHTLELARDARMRVADLLTDTDKGGVEAESRLDANDHQVQGVGKFELQLALP